MTSAMFIALFIVLAFSILALLSVLSSDNQEKKNIKKDIASVDRALIQMIKFKYLTFVDSIRTKNLDILKEICTLKLFKQLDIKKMSASKIVCILNSNVLRHDKNVLEVEFVSRSTNTELLYNKCIFSISSTNLKLDSIN